MAKQPDLRSDKWNPLNELDPSSRSFGDDCAALCAALIKTDANEHQKHFPDSAREGITGATMFTVRDARSRPGAVAMAQPNAAAPQRPPPAAKKP